MTEYALDHPEATFTKEYQNKLRLLRERLDACMNRLEAMAGAVQAVKTRIDQEIKADSNAD